MLKNRYFIPSHLIATVEEYFTNDELEELKVFFYRRDLKEILVCGFSTIL